MQERLFFPQKRASCVCSSPPHAERANVPVARLGNNEHAVPCPHVTRTEKLKTWLGKESYLDLPVRVTHLLDTFPHLTTFHNACTESTYSLPLGPVTAQLMLRVLDFPFVARVLEHKFTLKKMLCSWLPESTVWHCYLYCWLLNTVQL